MDRNSVAESSAAAVSAAVSLAGSESIGETLPGERIRRGSIRPTMGNPDLGEFGNETTLLLCFDNDESVSDLLWL